MGTKQKLHFLNQEMSYINALNSKSTMNFIFDLKLLKDYVHSLSDTQSKKRLQGDFGLVRGGGLGQKFDFLAIVSRGMTRIFPHTPLFRQIPTSLFLAFK